MSSTSNTPWENDSLYNRPSTLKRGILKVRRVNPLSLLPRENVSSFDYEHSFFKALCKHVQIHGVLMPISVRGNRIIDGDGRVNAAIKAGLDSVPVIDLEPFIVLSDIEIRNLNFLGENI